MSSLTATTTPANINTNPVTNLLEYSYKSMGRLEPVKSKGVGDYTMCRSLFLCPKSILSALKNLPLWWGGLLERYILYTAFQPTFLPHRPKTGTFSGGLSLSKGASHMNAHTQKLTLSVSTTKQNSLTKQLEIIGHSLDIFCTSLNENNRLSLKSDALELARMLDDLSNDLSRTSRFNILDKSKQLIAERVTFDQAKHYPDAVIKFAGMEVIA